MQFYSRPSSLVSHEFVSLFVLGLQRSCGFALANPGGLMRSILRGLGVWAGFNCQGRLLLEDRQNTMPPVFLSQEALTEGSSTDLSGLCRVPDTPARDDLVQNCTEDAPSSRNVASGPMP